MIISRTPYRVSLFGGGSDYPAWYRKNGGTVLGFAMNRYCYISVRELPPFFNHKHRIVYSAIEDCNTVEEIKHPAVRGVLTEFPPEKGLEIHHDGDLPARSGLGSSSSFTVGLINALEASHGRMISKKKLAERTIDIEQNVIKEHVGSQDQIWAAYGGMNRIHFQKDGDFVVSPVLVQPERRKKLTSNLMLFFSGVSRIAAKIAERKIANLDARHDHIVKMVSMVDDAESIISSASGDLSDIGRLLYKSWKLKRELAEGVTNPTVNEIFDEAMAGGALGGKLLGAGGGGFILFYAEPGAKKEIRRRLSKLIEVDIDVDNAGSQIVVYEPDGLGNKK